MKILLTGSTGFIGKNLALTLLKNKHTIIAVKASEGDTSFLVQNQIPFFQYKKKYNELYDFIDNESPDGIIHLASQTTEYKNGDEIADQIHSNITFPTQLLEAACQSSVKWFINIGTFWQHYNNEPYSPVNFYAASKQSFIDMARYYFESRNINFVTLELFDTFGPNDTRQKLMNLWLNSVVTGKQIEMSAGEQIIDISYIDNVSDGIITLLHLISEDINRLHCGKSFSLKSDKRLSLKELASLFENQTGAKLNIAWNKRNYRDREIMIPWDKGHNIPGWQAPITLEEGIRLFYKTNMNTTEH